MEDLDRHEAMKVFKAEHRQTALKAIAHQLRFYDVLRVDDDRLALVCADASGKGLAGGLETHRAGEAYSDDITIVTGRRVE